MKPGLGDCYPIRGGVDMRRASRVGLGRCQVIPA